MFFTGFSTKLLNQPLRKTAVYETGNYSQICHDNVTLVQNTSSLRSGMQSGMLPFITNVLLLVLKTTFRVCVCHESKDCLLLSITARSAGPVYSCAISHLDMLTQLGLCVITLMIKTSQNILQRWGGTGTEF